MNHPFVQIVLYSLKYILLSLFEFVPIIHLTEWVSNIIWWSFSHFLCCIRRTHSYYHHWVIIGDNRTKRVFWDPITSGHWSRLSQLTAKTINQWDSEADTDFSLGCNLLLWDPIDWLRPAQFLKHGHKSLAFWPTDQQFLESGSVSKMICYKSEISTSFSTGQYLPKLPCTDQLNKLLDNLP